MLNEIRTPLGTVTWPFQNIKPREVQIEALEKGFNSPGFAYFMRQRTGKTWTAYAEFCLLRKLNKVKWMVVICPNSLKQQWYDAIEEADILESICIYKSSNIKSVAHFFRVNKHGGVFILNYESVKPFMNMLGNFMLDLSKTYIVADESTKIKEPTNKSTKACILLADECPYKRILTGRPTANNNLDIWSQLRFISATDRNYYQHKFTFCILGGYQGRQIVKNINTELLQREIDLISYIAPDKYVEGFKKVYEPMRRVPLTGDLAKLYEKMENDLIFSLSDDIDITAPIALVKYLRLQQIGSGIAGDPDGEQHNLVEPSHNPRIKLLLEIIENEAVNKTIIVCRFKLSIKNIVEVLKNKGYKVSVLIGQMSGQKIEEEKKNFNEGDTNILVAQSQVLSYGHTLCGKDSNPCDSVIFYENSFSLIDRMQCESRPEKYGREIPISYYDFFASKMDKYIMSNLIKKEDASLALLNYARNTGLRPQSVDDEKVDNEFVF